MSLLMRVIGVAVATAAPLAPTKNTALVNADTFGSDKRRGRTENTGGPAQTTGGNTGSRGRIIGSNTGGRGGSNGGNTGTPATPVTRSARAHGSFPPGPVIQAGERAQRVLVSQRTTELQR